MISPQEIESYEYDPGDLSDHCSGCRITQATTKDGRELTDEELDELNDNHIDYFYDDIVEDATSSAIDRAMDDYDSYLDSQMGL